MNKTPRADKPRPSTALAVVCFTASHNATAADQQKPSANSPSKKERIGTYDSRAIAVAYCNTPMHRALAKHKKAERIDVTQELIDAIGSDERQRKHAMDIQKSKPISPFLLDLHMRFGGH